MGLDTTQIAGLYYLSSLEESLELSQTLIDIEKKLKLIETEERGYYEYYLSYVKAYNITPSWVHVTTKFDIDVDSRYTLSFEEAERIFHARLAVWESDALAKDILTQGLNERRNTLLKLNEVLGSLDVVKTDNIYSSDNLKLNEIAVRDDSEGNKDGFLFPIRKLNDLVGNSCKVGHTISVVGAPAMFKTTMALNMMYLNVFKRGWNAIYFYLEDTPERYHKNIMSRYSYEIGMNIQTGSLKGGIHKRDTVGIKKLEELQKSYDKNVKGKIYYVGMKDLDPDPIKFAHKMKTLINELDIKMVVTDYVQKLAGFVPARRDKREYLEQMVSTLSSLALGGFDNQRIVNVMLAQPNKESEKRTLKTGGRMTLYDSAEISGVERDSFIMLGLFADDEMKEGKECVYSILKNRDEASSNTPQPITVRPEFCFIGDSGNIEGGDSGQDDNIYSVSSMDEVLGSLDR